MQIIFITPLDTMGKSVVFIYRLINFGERSSLMAKESKKEEKKMDKKEDMKKKMSKK